MVALCDGFSMFLMEVFHCDWSHDYFFFAMLHNRLNIAENEA